MFKVLPSLHDCHAPGTQFYMFLAAVARKEVENLFSNPHPAERQFEPFGNLTLPYRTLGAVDSLNLFGLDELIIFSFYWANRNIYRRVVDAGANIGLHSILLSRCGYEVKAYEPDPMHFATLERNILLNDCLGVEAKPVAISTKAGAMEFVRVLGNTTSSHLAGSKSNPYGELERFPVNVEPATPLFAWADLIKFDVEGHEKEILLNTKLDDWTSTDALVEVGSEENAVAIFEHMSRIGVGLYSQKTNWQPVPTIEAMPVNFREGSLFVSRKQKMPWQA